MKNNSNPNIQGPVCPVPIKHGEKIILAHGSGGLMTQNLIKNIFLPHLGSPQLLAGNDFAIPDLSEHDLRNSKLSISTDSHVITPLFYPGGDIGRLAVCGTVNDVSMSGGIPLFMTAGFILEEGLPIETLEQIVVSMHEAAKEANITFVSGDTKVVEKGKADGLFITTTGIGLIPTDTDISGANAKPGDVILISGTIGDHGIAVLAARGNLGFETQIESDQAPLNHLIQEVLKAAPNIRVLRDPTRGGLATSLNEIAQQSNVGIILEGSLIPIQLPVMTACDLLGFDPLYVANEGKVIIILPENEANDALQALKKNKYGKNASVIGKVTDTNQKMVLMKNEYGTSRIVDVLSGELLPRIC